MTLNLGRISKTVESFMIDTVRIVRPGEPVMDPISLEETYPETIIYYGKAFVSPMGDSAATASGGNSVYRTQYEIGIPLEAEEIFPNDQCEVLDTTNSALTNLRLMIHSELVGTFATHRRVKAYTDVVST